MRGVPFAGLTVAIMAACPALATPSLEVVTPQEGLRSHIGLALSADGTTVVGFRPQQDLVTLQTDNRAFVWTRSTGYQSFDQLGPGAPSGATFAPRAVSADGSRIAGSIGDLPAVWERGGATTTLGLLPGGSAGASVLGISDDGRFAVGTGHDGGVVQSVTQLPGGGLFVTESPRRVPVLWNLEDGIAIALSPTRGSALDVSNGGVAVGELLLDVPGVVGVTAGFRWDSVHGQQFLPDPNPAVNRPYGFGGAAGISADGASIVGDVAGPSPPGSTITSSIPRAFLWEGGPSDGPSLARDGLTLIDTPPALIPRAEATAVSADGSTVVGGYLWNDGSSQLRPFVWTRTGGFQDLTVLLSTLGVSSPAYDLYGAIDVSADGRTIIGTGRTRVGYGRISEIVWIAVIPEPGTAVLLGTGLSLLAAGRRAPLRFPSPPGPDHGLDPSRCVTR